MKLAYLHSHKQQLTPSILNKWSASLEMMVNQLHFIIKNFHVFIELYDADDNDK